MRDGRGQVRDDRGLVGLQNREDPESRKFLISLKIRKTNISKSLRLKNYQNRSLKIVCKLPLTLWISKWQLQYVIC